MYWFFFIFAMISTSVAAQSTVQQQLNYLQELVADQQTRIDQQEATIRHLRGEYEILSHQVEKLKIQQQKIYIDLDRRLSKQTTAQPHNTRQPTATNPTGKTISITQEQPLVIPTDIQLKGNEAEAYQQVFNWLQAGEEAKAVAGFQQFLATYPEGQYADNAQYWLGEAFYTARDFTHALQAFQTLINQYPNSPKRSHAELKIGYTYYEKGDYEKARQILLQLKSHYPNTSVAHLADRRLRQMDQKGQ